MFKIQIEKKEQHIQAITKILMERRGVIDNAEHVIAMLYGVDKSDTKQVNAVCTAIRIATVGSATYRGKNKGSSFKAIANEIFDSLANADSEQET